MLTKRKLSAVAFVLAVCTVLVYVLHTDYLHIGGTFPYPFQTKEYGSSIFHLFDDTSSVAAFNGSFPSLRHEFLRRRLEDTAAAWWDWSSQKLRAVQEDKTNKENAKKLASELLNRGTSYHNSLKTSLQELRDVDGRRVWRERETARLAAIVKERIRKLQNPADCARAKKIVFQIDYRPAKSTFGRGLVSHMHMITQALLYAYRMDRTLVLLSKGFDYDPRGWEGMFKPLSETCRDPNGTRWKGSKYDQSAIDSQVIYMDYLVFLRLKIPLSPYSVPRDLATDLARVHGDPSAWWVGQFVSYVMRPNQNLSDVINKRVKALPNFQHPIAGLQVRRGWDKNDPKGDRIAPKPLSLYMDPVTEFFSWQRAQGATKKRVFIATDSADVIAEAKAKYEQWGAPLLQRYPDYEVVNDPASTASAKDPSSRETLGNLISTVLDLHLLAQSDFLVCTMTSNLCRAAYELMQARPGDHARKVAPVDMMWLMWLYPRSWRAVEAETEPGWLPLKVGDGLELDWAAVGDGVVTGKNLRLGKSGVIALHKLVPDDPPFDDSKA